VFLLARALVVTVAWYAWRWGRGSVWLARNLPWLRIVSFLTMLATLIWTVLEIIIKVKLIWG
jgi:hypothetical protein